MSRKHGLLAVVDGGTVFLDEVGDLPLDAQVMLLRFLQSGEIRPVGSTETRRVDVRLIAATHRDLGAAVERGTFREDLYYRLRRVVLEVPPLRARRDDISLLVERFRVRMNLRYSLAVRGVTTAALRLLEHHPWRGNVRELEAVLEQAMIFGHGDRITPEELDLPTPASSEAASETGAARSGPADSKTLTWLQREALRITGERRELRRRELVARFRVSRELAGLVRLGFLRLVGRGRGARYVPLSLWLGLGDAANWALALI